MAEEILSHQRRWTPQRKTTLVEDVAFGRIDRAAALDRHGISEAEFAAWERTFRVHGRAGLHVGSEPMKATLRREESAPWRSAQAPASLAELSDWFTGQAALCRQLAATYGREGRKCLDRGDRLRGLDKLDVAETAAAQGRSYEHAAALAAQFSGAAA